MKAIKKLCTLQVLHISKPGRYGDGLGLYLQVTKTLGKSWIFRYERDGVEHHMGLGSAQSLSLADAREAARKARFLLVQGIDPLMAKRDEESRRFVADAKRDFAISTGRRLRRSAEAVCKEMGAEGSEKPELG